MKNRWEKIGLLEGLTGNVNKKTADLFRCDLSHVINEKDMEGIQKLILANDIFDALENGKTCTIRKGRRDIKLGLLNFESIDKREEIVYVKIVMFCILKNTPIQYVTNDGFKDHKDMEEQMKRFYPDIDENTEVTIVEFVTQ